MAVSIKFEGVNRRFENNPEFPANDHDGPFCESQPMWGYANGVVTFTRWRLTPEEMEEVVKTGEIWLGVRCGKRPMQPHWLGSLGWVKRSLAETGLWRVRPQNQPKLLPPPAPEGDLEPA